MRLSGNINQSNQQETVKYELTETEVLELYYSEPRLAALMDIDVIRLIDRHLVVNLKEFITPKTRHLTAFAKRNIPSCCVGVRYLSHEKKRRQDKKQISCTLDLLYAVFGFPRRRECRWQNTE